MHINASNTIFILRSHPHNLCFNSYFPSDPGVAGSLSALLLHLLQKTICGDVFSVGQLTFLSPSQ